MLAPKLDSQLPYNGGGVAVDSLWIFAVTVAAGAGAILISEE